MNEIMNKYGYQETVKGSVKTSKSVPSVKLIGTKEFERLGQSTRMTKTFVKEPKLMTDFGKLILFGYV